MPLRWLASTSVKNNPLILIGYSVRAIAQIARGLGYEKVFALDLFADADTKQNVSQALPIADPQAVEIDPNLARKHLCGLLEKLPRADALFTSGIEKHHALMNVGSHGWRWLNCSSSTIAQVRDFRLLAEQLDRIQIPYPQTCWSAPQNAQSLWLGKLNASSGGSGIVQFDQNNRWREADYWQRVTEGDTISVSVCVRSDRSWELIGFSRQLAPLTGASYNRFRFEGLMSGIRLNEEIKNNLIGYIEKLIVSFNFQGWLGVDFLVSNEQLLLLEINPRPTAALELFDCLRLYDSPLLHHIWACTQCRTDRPWRARPRQLAGLRVVYARQPVVIGIDVAWPDWIRDIPNPGSRIPADAPICSVVAEHEEEYELEQLLAFRARKMEHLLQQSSNKN